MKEGLIFSIAQMNSILGDFKHNKDEILKAISHAKDELADIIIFPELCVSGYFPKDLFFYPDFCDKCKKTENEIIKSTLDFKGVILLGNITNEHGVLFNSCVVIQNGKVLARYHKTILANNSLFDEKRYFQSGESLLALNIHGFHIGLSICEDFWHSDGPFHQINTLASCEALVIISASPFYAQKQERRELMQKMRALDEKSFIITCNLSGAQDDLIFDGASTVFSPTGEMLSRLKSFTNDQKEIFLPLEDAKKTKIIEGKHSSNLDPFFDFEIVTTTKSLQEKNLHPKAIIENYPQKMESIYLAICKGIKSYTKQNGFEKVLLALSGGIDSALVLALLVDSLGAKNVKAIFLPSKFSSNASKKDARYLVNALNVEFETISISPFVKVFEKILEKEKDFKDITKQNIQARVRASIVMALSNEENRLVFNTSNKSEISVGYSTLYGDMIGAYAPIKDLLKTEVFALCRYRNTISHVFNKSILEKAPSAELTDNQKDSDFLPDYETLDTILKCLFYEKDLNKIPSAIDQKEIKKTLNLYRKSEYKRAQSIIGPILSSYSFNSDYRMPISSKYNFLDE